MEALVAFSSATLTRDRDLFVKTGTISVPVAAFPVHTEERIPLDRVQRTLNLEDVTYGIS